MIIAIYDCYYYYCGVFIMFYSVLLCFIIVYTDDAMFHTRAAILSNMTPTMTPSDRLPDTNPTMAVITVITHRRSNDCGLNKLSQSPVLYTTSNITPTTAATGISLMARPKKRQITIKSTLVITDENWVFAPFAKFSLLWPTNTQPPNPPVNQVAIFAIPWTRLSRNELPFIP